uniref:Guanylate cyclase domain-containing protein n=1 Tax=Alexandrium catenella TaxID=2925 RepID=A0A7S1LEV7_ALECA
MCPQDVRNMERDIFTERMITQDQFRQWHFVFYFDQRPYVRHEAALNILTTVFVCMVLCVASLFFSSDANTLVLNPVEKMINKVEAIRDNPLRATQMADEEFKREEMRKSAEIRKSSSMRALHSWKKRWCCQRHQEGAELMETVILEKTIIKLGSLLALGFGEAGANIVSQNMRGSDTSGVNAMVSGRRVDCIVGNVRICDFSIATEVLQEEVMQFVNRIAEIVHGVVNEFHGAANKNMGDTFLVIWRTAGMAPPKVRRMADMSVYAFAKVLGGVHRSNVLAAYRYHPGLQQRLGSDCRVNLSFGLHCGWAIEGAVGSEFKIDASYLSPNVSIAGGVEHATRIYAVSILVSEAVVRLCSKDMTANMRLIDKVRFAGTNEPIELYCLDLDYLDLPVDEPLRRMPIWNTQMRYRSRQYLEGRKRKLWRGDAEISMIFEDDGQIACMRGACSEEFRQHFNMGYQNYAQGEWLVARQRLSKTLAMLCRKDGPSAALLRFMGTHGFKAPTGWAGVRDLGNLDRL